MSQQSIQEMIYEETQKRLKIMEDPGYEFPPRAGKLDAIGIIASIGICLLLIILCMTGGIV